MSIQCVVCGSDDTFLRRTVTAGESASVLISPAEDAERNRSLEHCITSLWGGPTAELHDCRACGFGFARPFVAGSPEFYRLAYKRSSYPTMKWEYARTIESLEARQSIASALEIGAGAGFFLDLISPRFVPPESVFATEFFQPSVDKMRAKGFSAELADMRHAESLNDRRFECIFMFQVLEHMDGVQEVFARLASLLAPGGSAFIAVPNRRRTQFNEEHGSLMDMPPNHIGRWTPESFAAIAKRHGLRLARAEYEPFKTSAFVKQDVYYSHRKRAQRPKTLAGAVRGIGNDRIRKLTIVGDMLLFAPTRLPVWLAAARRRDVGGSLWAEIILDPTDAQLAEGTKIGGA